MHPIVLVMQKSGSSLAGVQPVLDEHGYATRVAFDFDQADRLLDAEDVGAILIDLGRYHDDGLRYIHAVRQRDPLLVIICLLDATSDETPMEGIRAGADHFLTKPIDPDNLLAFLAPALEIGKLRRKAHLAHRQQRRGSLYYGESPAARTAWDLAANAAEQNAPVMIQGETGTGKGILARWIHENSPRCHEAFVEVNCSTLRGDLLASELFGHKKGAFTSAVENREGLVEVADGGTLFLDEIGDMDMDAQAQLLKLIEQKEFRRVGENRIRRSEFRLICASNKNLAAEVEAGHFRSDLYFRICVFPICMPALRERQEDLRGLSRQILVELGAHGACINPSAWTMLEAYRWPGNIRELRNVLERACMLCADNNIGSEHLVNLQISVGHTAPSVVADLGKPNAWDLDSAEAHHIQRALEHFEGDVDAVAKALGVSRATFYRKCKKHGISRGANQATVWESS